MATIRVTSIRSQIITRNQALVERLQDEFTVTPKASWFARRRRANPFKGWDGKVRFVAEDGRFLTGLLVRVLDVCEALGEPVKFTDLRQRPPRVNWPVPTLTLRDDYQVALVDSAVAAVRGIVWAATNAGKTEMAIALAARLGVRTLFVVPSLELVTQTVDRFAGALGTRRGIGTITEGRADVGEYLTVANVQSFVALLAKGALQRYSNEVGCVIGDEAHTMASASQAQKAWSRFLLACPAYYRYGLSATPFVGKRERDLKLVGLFGDVVGRVRSAELVARGYSARPTVRWITYAPSTVWAEPDRTFQDDFRALVVEHAARNDAIVDTVVARCLPARTLILITQYEHARQLIERFEARGHAALFLSGRDSSAVRQAGKATFRSGAMPVLIATKIMGTGVDIKEIDKLVIGAAGKASHATIQQVGRALRSREDKREVDIYDLVDLGLYDRSINPLKRYLELHFHERVGTYASEEIEQVGYSPPRRRQTGGGR